MSYNRGRGNQQDRRQDRRIRQFRGSATKIEQAGTAFENLVKNNLDLDETDLFVKKNLAPNSGSLTLGTANDPWNFLYLQDQDNSDVYRLEIKSGAIVLTSV